MNYDFDPMMISHNDGGVWFLIGLIVGWALTMWWDWYHEHHHNN